MAVYATAKEVIDTLLVRLRAGTGLENVVWRKGAQRSIKLGAGEEALGIVTLAGAPEGEQPAGSGNHWWQWWDVTVALFVPDQPDDPGTAEDLRLDLVEAVHGVIHQLDTRSLVGGAKTGRVKSVTCGVGPALEEAEQTFRWAEWTLTWRILRA